MVQVKERFARIYIVQVVLFGVIGGNGAVVPDKVVDKAVGKFQIPAVLFDVVQFQDRLYHAAVDIVPGRLRALFYFLNIPDRGLGAALF